MALLRVYLLTGLIAHKIVWEVLKRPGPNPVRHPQPERSRWSRFLASVKIVVLLGLIGQTVLPEVLPILGDASVLRAIGAPIYTAGLALALLGRVQLGTNWSDIESAKVNENQALVSTGIYRYIRHPIYAGDLLLLFGLELALNSWLVLAVAALAAIVVRQALGEEAMLADRLAGYDDYSRCTKRFVPFVV